MDKRKNNTFQKIGNYKCICGKEFTKAQSYNAHLSHCIEHKKEMGRPLVDKRFHTIEKEYICKCGKIFKTNSSYVGHTSHCEIYLGKEKYLKNKNKFIKAIKKASSKYVGKDWYKIHTKESLEKQSKTIINKILSNNWHNFTSSYGLRCIIKFNSKKYTLRSSWEFIYAVWLYIHNIDFEYETVSVKCIENNEGYNNFICDFKIENKIIEIKGIPSKKDYYIKESFESNNYDFKILYGDSIFKIKNELINKYKIDVDYYINYIKENQKNYKVIDFKQFDKVIAK